jgi:hypothetical protein
MDGDDRAQPRRLVVAKDDLLVVIEIGMGENGHCGFLFVVLYEPVIQAPSKCSVRRIRSRL